MYDVCVIGAGPAGSTVAWKLSLRGWKVALLEKDEFAGKTNVCAGGLERLDAEELDLPINVIEKNIEGTTIFSKKGKVKEDTHSVFLTVQRKKFDRFLAERAGEKADYFTSTLVTRVQKQNGNWLIESKKKKFRARIVVFADGPASRVRREHSIGFKPDRGNCYAAMIREFKLESPRNKLEMIFDEKVSPNGYGWLFPKKDHVNIGIIFISNTKYESKKGLDYLINNYFTDYSEKKPFLERAALIPLEPAQTFSSEQGLLVVGDAGGFADPFTGEGISFGVKSSLIASEVIQEALEKNNVSLVKEFDKKIAEQDWFASFKVQSFILKKIRKSKLAYNLFSTKVFPNITYPIIMILGKKLWRVI